MKKIKRADIIITCFFVSALIIFIGTTLKNKNEGNKVLFIEAGGKKYYYSLDQKKEIEVAGENGITVVKIDNGKFSFSESPCKNKECIKSGWVSIHNFPIICLPNKVSAYIIDERTKEGEYDGITR